MKVKTYHYILGAVVILGAGYYMFTRKRKQEQSESSDSGSGLSVSVGGKQVPVKSDKYPLVFGSKGENVKTLQRLLNKLAIKKGLKVQSLKIDGILGTRTSSLLHTLGFKLPFTAEMLTDLRNKAV